MLTDPLGEPRQNAGPLAHIDARAKLLACLAFVAAVASIPAGRYQILGAAAMLLAIGLGSSGLEPRAILRRWLAFAPVAGILALTIAPSHPARPDLGITGVSLFLLAQNSVAFLAVVLLSATTPFRALLSALARLRVPATLITVLLFMYRYVYVILDEFSRMAQARRARSFRRTRGPDWALLTNLLGVLLVRAFERGERVYAAMVARGWDGTLRTLDPEPGPTPT